MYGKVAWMVGLMWVSGAGLGWSQPALNIIGVSAVRIGATQEVLLSVAFTRPPDPATDTWGGQVCAPGQACVDLEPTAFTWVTDATAVLRTARSTMALPASAWSLSVWASSMINGVSGWATFGAASIPDMCDGQTATVFGTAGHDVIYAEYVEWVPPVVLALHGDDLVFCRTQCTVCGGFGHDHLHGGSGADRLFGEEGHDLLFGGHSDDVLDGGPGEDVLKGGHGKDTLSGGPGQDICCGDGQADTATGCELKVSVP